MGGLAEVVPTELVAPELEEGSDKVAEETCEVEEVTEGFDVVVGAMEVVWVEGGDCEAEGWFVTVTVRVIVRVGHPHQLA